MHLSPGTATLLGTSGDDNMQTGPAFDTLLGGLGRDELAGGLASSRVEKLFGGEGADLFHWSGGFNIVHGGQPQLPYEADGPDVMDYSGAGTVTITLNRHAVPHEVPGSVAVFDGGVDHLFSIERIQWNAKTDRIMLGDGVDVIEDKVIREPGRRPGVRPGGADGDHADRGQLRSGHLIAKGTPPHQIVGDDGANVLVGHAGDDTFYGAGGDDTLIGGYGSDGYVYMPGDGSDTIVDRGHATDIDELILAGGIQPQDVAVHRPADAPNDLLLTLPDGGRILIKNHLGSPFAGIERIVFDHAPAWSRTDLRRLAGTAPLGGGTLATLKTVVPTPPVGFAVLDGPMF
jgi:Ca2+-binding RTX toxin-like protein